MNFRVPNVSLIYGRPNSGKTTLLAFLVEMLKNFCTNFYILGRRSSDTAANLHLAGPQTETNDSFDFDSIDTWRQKSEKKLLIMDDFMHIDFSGKKRTQINDILSTARHHNMYVIVCTHLLKSIGKIFRLSCENFISFMIDEDSLDQLSVFSGKKKSELRLVHLDQYQFVYAHITGDIKKMSINTTLIE